MADHDLDRHLAATPHKLQKAREKGQTARSADFVAALVFAATTVFVTWHGASMALDLLHLCRAALVQLGEVSVSAVSLWPLVAKMLADAGLLLLPLLLLLMATACAACLVQSGVILSLEPIKPDLHRLNPAAGLKRLFARRTLFEASRSCVKLAILCATAWFALKSLLPQFHGLAALPPLAFLNTLIADVSSLGLKMASILLLIAMVDLAYNRHDFARTMRMSQRELKDETKAREGDPRIRARLRQLRRETLERSRALVNTARADVVLTNPTHYAVALHYAHGEMDAPVLVAKGMGHLASAMRHIAFHKRIPVVQNPPLARGLFAATPIDQAVPPQFHAEVARVIVWVFALREQRRMARGAA